MIDINVDIMEIHHQFCLVLVLYCLVVLIFRNKIPESNSWQSNETKIDGIKKIPLLSLDEHEGAAEENAKYKQKTNPDRDGLGDINLLPVLILKLVQELAASGSDPRCGDSSGGRGDLGNTSQSS